MAFAMPNAMLCCGGRGGLMEGQLIGHQPLRVIGLSVG